MNPTVVTIGETMLRLAPANGRPLEGSDLWSVDVAGAESNVAVSLARLGVATGWVSRLPDHALGRKVAGALRQHGVDISRVVWADGRQGLYFLDPGSPPRSTTVIYDRSHSTMAQMEPEQVDWDYIRSASLVHLTGITPALGAGPRRLVEQALREVRAAGGQVSFDVNYRAGLWPAGEARAVLEPILAQVDLLIMARGDLHLLFPELAGSDAEALQALTARFGPTVAVLTCGDEGALALAAGQLSHRPATPAAGVDRVGRGDAFTAGFLYGYMHGGVDYALACGTALAALKMTYPGDYPWVLARDLAAALNGGAQDIVR